MIEESGNENLNHDPMEPGRKLKRLIENSLESLNIVVEDMAIALVDDSDVLRLKLIVKPQAMMNKDEKEVEEAFQEIMKGL